MMQDMVDEVLDLLATMGHILSRFRVLQGAWDFVDIFWKIHISWRGLDGGIGMEPR